MASVILSTSDDLKAKLKRFSWVNWSEVARVEVRKKEIFENYLKTGKVSDEEWAFCEGIDWHPVDELPLKEGYAKKLANAKKGPFKTAKRIDFWKE